MACGAVIGSNRSQIVFEVCVSARNLWLTTPLAQKLWLQVCYLEKAVRKPQFFIEATSFYEPSLCQESAHHMTSVYIQDDSMYPLWISASAYITSLLLCLLTCKVILYNLNSCTSAAFYSADSNPYSFLSDGVMTTRSHHSVVGPSQTSTNATAQVVTVV